MQFKVIAVYAELRKSEITLHSKQIVGWPRLFKKMAFLRGVEFAQSLNVIAPRQQYAAIVAAGLFYEEYKSMVDTHNLSRAHKEATWPVYENILKMHGPYVFSSKENASGKVLLKWFANARWEKP